MKQRGKKSAAALAVAHSSVTTMAQRPQPPAHLPSAACAVWREVTGSRPADYFDPGSLGLLEAYSRALAEHRRIMAKVEVLDPAEDVAIFAKLTRLADAHAARVSQIGVRMRLSQSSRLDSRAAGRKVGGGGSSAERIRRNYGLED